MIFHFRLRNEKKLINGLFVEECFGKSSWLVKVVQRQLEMVELKMSNLVVTCEASYENAST